MGLGSSCAPESKWVQRDDIEHAILVYFTLLSLSENYLITKP